MIPTNYDPRTSEEKWYQYWLEHRFFHSTVDKKRTPYCIVIPPPNVTGVLHMGHMLNNTIQDVLVRRARLLGKNACWVPGTDHASIATEAKVVAKLKSEIGVLYLNSLNEVVLKKTLKENDLTFHRLFIAKPHVFIGKDNPLANKNRVSLEDLKEYPRLSYEQGEHNSFYFSEEILSTLESQKEIKVCDRATLFNLLIGLNGYTICSGVINEQLNGKDIIAVPLEVDDYMEIGYITHNKAILSRFGQLYIDILKEYTKKDS